MSDDTASARTVSQCLSTIGVDMEALQGCINVEEEFFTIKRTYFKTILLCHPDKGGDAATFRNVQTSFEVLRELQDSNRIISFYNVSSDSVKDAYSHAWQDFNTRETPSYDFYYEAATEIIPKHKMECAKSARSMCKQTTKRQTCGTNIPKGDVRIGSWNEETGTYSWWIHLACWRVPNRVWMGFPTPETEDFGNKHKFGKAFASMNQVLLCGFAELPPEKQEQVIDHVMNKENWARKRNIKLQSTKTTTKSQSDDKMAKQQHTDAQLVPSGSHTPREQFIIPCPGKDGALPASLAGKTIVLTGTFPELGGGSGLSLGKGKAKTMIKSFGGRVTGSVSGKTDLLVVGKDPGFSKVSNARSKTRCTLVSLQTLTKLLHGNLLENVAKPMEIDSFSSGFAGNGLAVKASPRALEIASGVVVPKIEESSDAYSSSKRVKIEHEEFRPSTMTTKASKDNNLGDRNKPVNITSLTTVAKAIVTKSTVAPKKKTASKKKVNPKEKEEFTVVCDGCGVDCTTYSIFVEACSPTQPEQDFCGDCGEGKVGIPQSNDNTLLSQTSLGIESMIGKIDTNY